MKEQKESRRKRKKHCAQCGNGTTKSGQSACKKCGSTTWGGIFASPAVDYMDKQPHINIEVRSVLVDWLVEVVDECQYTRPTLHMTIAYVDRFLSLFILPSCNILQLLGITCLLIAAYVLWVPCQPSVA